MNVGFILKEKSVSGKHLIQVHLEILSRSVENMVQFPLVVKLSLGAPTPKRPQVGMSYGKRQALRRPLP